MGKNILIVDDDPVIRALTTDCISMFGHQVEALESGPACLERLSHSPLPDIIFLDMMMPEMNGLEVLKSLRENPQTAGLYVILLSATTETKQIFENSSARPNACLAKPFQIKDLSAVIAQAGE